MKGLKLILYFNEIESLNHKKSKKNQFEIKFLFYRKLKEIFALNSREAPPNGL